MSVNAVGHFAGTPVEFPTAPTRNRWQAIKRGFRERCPNCGEGRMFRAYLKVADTCPVCGEELFHQRADDAPPYLTILVVGHIVGGSMLAVEEINDTLPLWIHMLIWPILTVALSLTLLPRFKGALIGYQWALRMHGFDSASNDQDSPSDAL
ncbi:MAG TPA: DUF983 domain-containing protein [Beijerinckiaceae bacterium]|nr:DUF983 domain-containing protein [Beijerinckiaceae bacterium]